MQGFVAGRQPLRPRHNLIPIPICTYFYRSLRIRNLNPYLRRFSDLLLILISTFLVIARLAAGTALLRHFQAVLVLGLVSLVGVQGILTGWDGQLRQLILTRYLYILQGVIIVRIETVLVTLRELWPTLLCHSI